MIKSFKVRLDPTSEQVSTFKKCFGFNRFVYNWCLNYQKENYDKGNKFISKYELKKIAILLKDKEEFSWMKELPAKILHQAVFDANAAFINFFRKKAKYPRFKSRKNSKQSFWNPNDAIEFTTRKVKLQKIGWVKLKERNHMPLASNYINPRITFDGLNYWISAGVEVGEKQANHAIKTEGIGIDLGVKTLFTVSNGLTQNKPDVRKQVKSLKRMQRQVSRLYIKYRGKEKSKNLLKIEKRIRKQYQRISNYRTDLIHKFTTQLVDSNPEFIVIEDLNVSGMMKNKHLSRAISECNFFEIRRQLEYKCAWNGIKLIVADRFFPSSKMCSSCGSIKKDLKLSDRIYSCECGLNVDRDLNASLNLKKYGMALSEYKPLDR